MSISILALEIMKEEMLDAIASLHPDLRADVWLTPTNDRRSWLIGRVSIVPPGFCVVAVRQGKKVQSSRIPALYWRWPHKKYGGAPYRYITLKKWKKLAKMRCK